ncbi:MAG: hypothetical protein M1826_001609 [Phylliscum demangeonii]|nr:MAG: hypothetical protein M1826_001609 [Phylliscum demangeonii]
MKEEKIDHRSSPVSKRLQRHREEQSDAENTAGTDPKVACSSLPTVADKVLRMSYHIGRGEQGVLTFEPYKSQILPFWRFRTLAIAKKSSQDLWTIFLDYDAKDDFVGMDLTRKFIQMVGHGLAAVSRPATGLMPVGFVRQGMTRAKRYANHAGGRKYDKETGRELPKSENHPDAGEKLAASEVFRQVWNGCRCHEGYRRRKEAFMKEQKAYDKEQKRQAAASDHKT